MTDADWMALALEEARKALEEGEMPVGCVIVKDGIRVAAGHNLRERTQDPTAHAEVVAMREAAKRLNAWRLTSCTLYVTLEPCPMCAGAIVASRISRLVWGAADDQRGCAGSVYRIPEDPAFSHFCPTDGGVLEEECIALLRAFFSGRRNG